jgi:hypothetical protein
MNRFGSVLRRRPSAAMIVAVFAVFLAGGGVGYAATALPNNSVGNKQLKNGAVSNFKLAGNAVGFRKIIPGTIGRVRVDKNAIQLRVSGTCAAGSAVSTIANTGKVTCNATKPAEYDTPGASASVTSASTAAVVAYEALPAGSSYIGFADPQLEVVGTAGTAQQVTLTCELALGTSSSATLTRNVTVDLTANHETEWATLPLTATAPSSTAASGAAVICVRAVSGSGATPTVTAVSNLNTLQTSANTSAATPTTTTTPYSVTTPTTTTNTTTTTTTTGTTTTGTTTTP